MDPMTLGFGVVAIGFGSYTSFLRAKKPEKLGKLQAMQKRWGAEGRIGDSFGGVFGGSAGNRSDDDRRWPQRRFPLWLIAAKQDSGGRHPGSTGSESTSPRLPVSSS